MGKAILTPIDNPEKVVKASNCLMSDGVTSVEGAFPEMRTFSIPSTTIGSTTYTEIETNLPDNIGSKCLCGIYVSVSVDAIVCGFSSYTNSVRLTLYNSAPVSQTFVGVVRAIYL